MDILNREELNAFFKKAMDNNYTLHAIKGEVYKDTEYEPNINIAWICNETKEKFLIKY